MGIAVEVEPGQVQKRDLQVKERQNGAEFHGARIGRQAVKNGGPIGHEVSCSYNGARNKD
ncbi:MAG: hypothetical protein DMG35_09170 [Acidobacteria bacterium]|nr:MAG: hypothetical protein AUH86_20535 [Acidobacteria bacterium 13_1_40CM_4_58_4]PYT61497.1 MAG: hypothetical protein DMG35_09170 [Acidobacteriota bacterium]